MKNIRRLLCLALSLALIVSAFPGSVISQAKKKSVKAKVSSVKFTNAEKKLRLQKGKKFRLKTAVTVSPNKGKYKKLKFRSSNKKVVLVNSKGLLKGKKTGTAKITATSKVNPKKKATISVTVTNDILVKKITLNKSKIEADEFNEEEIQLKVKKILPSNAKNKEIEWSTDNEDVADVDDDGEVTTGDVGTATITASAADKGGAYATCKVIVTENKEDVEEDDDREETTPQVPENPQNPTPPQETEPSKDTELPEQTPEITEQPEQTPEITEKPTEKPTPTPVVVQKLTLSVESDRIEPGDSKTITLGYVPADAEQKDVVWTVDHPQVSVSQDGVVTVDNDFTFEKGTNESKIVVTATSAVNPSVSKSIVLIVYDPEIVLPLGNPILKLSGDRMPAWALKGNYGTYTANDDGTAAFSSQPANEGKSGSVYNNGCSWYLNDTHSKVDVSAYKYVAYTLSDVSFEGNLVVKAMTWSGGDNAESFWDKTDTWIPITIEKHENGTKTIYFSVNRIFADPQNAKALGLTIKSFSGSADRELYDSDFYAREVAIHNVSFTNTLPEGNEDYEDIGKTETDPLIVPEVPLSSKRATNMAKNGYYGTLKFLSDEFVEFSTDPWADETATEESICSNNGCSWYLSDDRSPMDVSHYNYITIRIKSDVDAELITWSDSDSPECMWTRKTKPNSDKMTEVINGDGTKTLVYTVSSAFSNPAIANSVGVALCCYDEDKNHIESNATIYSIAFSNVVPDPLPAGQPETGSVERPETGSIESELYFSDLYRQEISDVDVLAGKNSNGIACTQLNYTKSNEYIFFELPESIDLEDYSTVSITAKVDGQLTFTIFDDMLDIESNSWWEKYSACTYPYYKYSCPGRDEFGEVNGICGIETMSFDLSDIRGTATGGRYIGLCGNSLPYGKGSYKNASYLLYSIVLEPKDGTDASTIRISSSPDADTLLPVLAEDPEEEVITPTEDCYEVELTEATETEATKDKNYRKNVVWGEDGSVTFTSPTGVNTGMVFSVSPDGKTLDMSDYDYVSVDVTSACEIYLLGFEDATSWWNKVEVYSGISYEQVTRYTIQFSIEQLMEKGLNPASLRGIGIHAYDNEGSEVTIHSIEFIKTPVAG